MESRKRLFIAFSITMILLMALLTSFGRSYIFSPTPSVTLPTLSTGSEDAPTPLEESNLQRIEITPQTVQPIIASLQQNQPMQRQLTTRLYWDDQAYGETVIEVFSTGELTQVQKTLPSSAVRYELIVGDLVYYWYQGSEDYFVQNLGAYAQDLAQMIPSYQTVLDLDVQDIRSANYEYRNGVACIYVEALTAPLYYAECYWIQAETGLLLSAETYDGDTLLYYMDGFSPVLPYDGVDFSLPDGTLASTLWTEENGT